VIGSLGNFNLSIPIEIRNKKVPPDIKEKLGQELRRLGKLK